MSEINEELTTTRTVSMCNSLVLAKDEKKKMTKITNFIKAYFLSEFYKSEADSENSSFRLNRS